MASNSAKAQRIKEVRNASPLIVKKTKELTPEMQLRHIKKIPRWIVFVDTPDEEMQIAAILQEPMLIDYIQEPTENVLMLAKLSE